MRPRVIELHIDEVLLSGFASAGWERTVAAMQRELQRLLGEPGLAANTIEPGLQADTRTAVLQTKPGESPEQVGARIAASVITSLTPHHHG